MDRIIVHNPCNEHTRYYRNYNLFWDDLTDKLKTKYFVTENRYFEKANSERYPIELKKQTCGKDNFLLLECEYVIEFENSGDFYVLSVSDDLTHAILNEKHNPYLKKVLISQYNFSSIQHHTGIYVEKYFPWIYFPSITIDLDQFYNERKKMHNLIDKMYFRGSSLGDRPILNHINKDYLEGVGTIGDQNTYFNDLIQYKIGLSVGGRGELCYRDIEYMALEIPFIRFEYKTKLNPNLIPNFHYISVERPDDLILDRCGDQSHAEMIEKRFLEIKDNLDFLSFVSKNAKTYYDTYLKRHNNVNHTLNLLGI